MSPAYVTHRCAREYAITYDRIRRTLGKPRCYAIREATRRANALLRKLRGESS